jgi:hypothetical protein
MQQGARDAQISSKSNNFLFKKFSLCLNDVCKILNAIFHALA